MPGRITSRSGIPYRIFPTPGEAAEAAAEMWAQTASAAQREGAIVSIALSGGSTPRALHRLMAGSPHREQVDWKRVEVFFGDERSVGAGHADSNFRMAKETLLSRVPLSPERIHRMEGEAEHLDEAARRYGEELGEVLERDDRGIPILDLVLLGLGDDGHTASLFPGTAALGEMSAFVVANEVPQLRTRRMTMTFSVLNAARSVLFLVAGEKKAPIVGEILNAPPGENAYPAACVRPDGNRLLWMLDAAAASAVIDEER